MRHCKFYFNNELVGVSKMSIAFSQSWLEKKETKCVLFSKLIDNTGFVEHSKVYEGSRVYEFLTK